MMQAEPIRRPWWRLIGPWQIRPGLLSSVGLMYYLTYQAGQQGSTLLLTTASITEIILPGILGSALVYLVARLGLTWQRRHGIHWTSYLVSHIAIALTATMLRFLSLVDITIVGVGPNLVSFLRLLGTFLLTSAVAGAIGSRHYDQVVLTREALKIARDQQINIITADEEARRQVALLLHDRVQAGLLVTCLELRSLSRDLPTDAQSTLNGLVEKLESIRTVDVRSAARVLSPNLEQVDFQTAVEDLAGQYEAVFHTSISIDASAERELEESWPFTALAIYRIVDQALINVAAHADARNVWVEVDKTDETFTLKVRDDGHGVQGPVQLGLGTTLITTWVRATGGDWSLDSSEEGVTITAVLRPAVTPQAKI